VDKAARASFATYFIHPPVLTLLMLGFSIVPFAPELKFVVVAAVAVPVCFTVGYALTRLPLVSRVL
jgi:glucans biosynthesis protein C